MSSGRGTSGSTGWPNSVRSQLYFESDKKNNTRTLKHKKANYGPADTEIQLAWNAGVFVPVIVPVVEEESIFGILERELALINAWNCPQQMSKILDKLTSVERKLFGSSKHLGETFEKRVAAASENEAVKTKHGSLVFKRENQGPNGGFWVELRGFHDRH